MSLASVVTVATRKPMRLLVYGIDGIGKSTLAAQSESPVFIGIEEGTTTLRTATGDPVPRFPEPHTWSETFEALQTLETGEHNYKTVVLDTLDWLEPLCWAHVVKHAGRLKDGSVPRAIEDIPFGSGYIAAVDEWRLLCSRLDMLRAARGMQVVLLAHALIRTFKNPEGDDYDRYEVKLQSSNKISAAGLMREWCDAVLFATHEQYTTKTDKTTRAKGISTGARVLHAERTAAFDAKNRYNLPRMLPLDWAALREAVEVGQTASVEVLQARIEAALETAPAALVQRVRTAVVAAGDNTIELARINNKLTAELSIAATEKGATS